MRRQRVAQVLGRGDDELELLARVEVETAALHVSEILSGAGAGAKPGESPGGAQPRGHQGIQGWMLKLNGTESMRDSPSRSGTGPGVQEVPSKVAV